MLCEEPEVRKNMELAGTPCPASKDAKVEKSSNHNYNIEYKYPSSK